MVYHKFESIKLRIIKGRQLKPFPTAKVLQEHEDRIKALEEASANSGSGSSGSSGGSQQQEPQQQEQQQTPVTRTLSFTINDGTDAIEGATVVIGSTTKTTGSAGGCTFSEMADDTYSVEVSATGYTTKTESITSDETHTSFTISLVAESPSSP